jgi:hypothetical protein
MHSTVLTTICLQDFQTCVTRACPVFEHETSMGHTHDLVTQEFVAFKKCTSEQSSPKAPRHILLITKDSGRPFIQWKYQFTNKSIIKGLSVQ